MLARERGQIFNGHPVAQDKKTYMCSILPQVIQTTKEINAHAVFFHFEYITEYILGATDMNNLCSI